MELWRECITNEENARAIRSRRGRTHRSDSLGKRGTRAQSLPFMGELSAARTALGKMRGSNTVAGGCCEFSARGGAQFGP